MRNLKILKNGNRNNNEIGMLWKEFGNKIYSNLTVSWVASSSEKEKVLPTNTVCAENWE